MIRISQIKLPVRSDSGSLKSKAAQILKIAQDDIKELAVLRRSVDARKKNAIFYIYNISVKADNEEGILSSLKFKAPERIKKYNITACEEKKYSFPYKREGVLPFRPVIIGDGPCGLFCAYELARAGFAPIVLERGADAEERRRKVEEFWAAGKLDSGTNVQFGEGGAGTFSDGKVNTGVNDRDGRNNEVLSAFVRCGAPEDIMYDAHAHIGTDILVSVVTALRNECVGYGAEFFFNTKAEEIVTDDEGRVCAVRTADGRLFSTRAAILAIGHSARDTFMSLYRSGVKMAAKPFAVGVRAEHPQEMIDRSQYGENAALLPPASYKLTAKTGNGRSVYSFCMCPGGYVVNASSEEGMCAVNGMSLRARDSGKANAAIVAAVSPEDYLPYKAEGTPEELSGMDFQRMLEKRAYEAGKGSVPVCDLKSFRSGTAPASVPAGAASKGALSPANVRDIFPSFISDSIDEAFTVFGKKIRGFDDPGTILYGAETRTSSPVRIPRNEAFQSSMPGLFPCGEGAGYAGGITSAAMDGIKTAEAAAAFILSLT